MAIKSMKDLDTINLANHEFTGDELGALLLESVRQAKAGQGVVREQPVVNEAIEARQNVGLSQREFAEILGVSVRTLEPVHNLFNNNAMKAKCTNCKLVFK